MLRGKVRPIVKQFPAGKQHTWQQQQLFMKLTNLRQEVTEPYRFGNSRSLYGKAKYSSR
jgi:hypothetical protein